MKKQKPPETALTRAMLETEVAMKKLLLFEKWSDAEIEFDDWGPATQFPPRELYIKLDEARHAAMFLRRLELLGPDAKLSEIYKSSRSDTGRKDD